MNQPATINDQPSTASRRLFLVDGSGYIFRAYHALPPLTRADGTPVGAVYGFVTMLTKLMEGMRRRDGDHLAVIFDAGRQTFRNRMYAGYKANRPETPEDLIPQFPLVREATRALNIPAIELADYEADDLIATYARDGVRRGMEVVVVSSDKDLMQLIGEGISLYDPMKQKPIGPEQVMEKFGIGPDKVLDVLALMGDSSDNVPGVPGIGPKTAAELIHQFGDLDALLARAGEITQPKRRETLLANIEQAKLSRELIRLCEDAPLPEPIDAFVLKEIDLEKLLPFLQQQNFKSLAAKFGKGSSASQSSASSPGFLPSPRPPLSKEGEGAGPTPVARHYTLVQDEAMLAQWIAKAKIAGHVAFDTETTGLDAMQAKLVGVSLCIEPGHACYIPLGHVEGARNAQASPSQSASPSPRPSPSGREGEQHDLFSTQPSTKDHQLLPGQLPLTRALELLKPLLADPSVVKIGQNIKYDMLVLKKYGIEITPLHDTMLMSYCLHAGAHAQNMDELSSRYLGHTPISYDSVTGTGRARISFAEVALDKAMEYAAEDADVTLRLYWHFRPEIAARHLLTIYETIERPLVPVLVAMEARGVMVDRKELSSLSVYFAGKLAGLEREIHQLAGEAFNIGSPKQLGDILFGKMQLPGGRKSGKTGAYNTSAQVLEELAESGLELPAKVLEWRQFAKLKSTYSDALEHQINPQTGRVHTSYAMAIASTGRLSSTDPNLQNIPIRTEEGRKIRRAFIAREGYRLLSADYSQIELRLLAHIADIGTLKEAFRHGDDIHAITASQIFGVKVDQVDADLRRKAKTINFGIIYGISAHGLSTRLGIGRAEAAEYIAKYFAQYPGIREYMDTTKEFARAHGYVATLYGRRCHLPGINDKNGNMRAFSERAAINAPLQGTAADIIKRAMIAMDGALLASAVDAAMLLQVHDELVFEVRAGEEARLIPLVKKAMEGAAHLSVPLEVEIGLGHNWGEIH